MPWPGKSTTNAPLKPSPIKGEETRRENVKTHLLNEYTLLANHAMWYIHHGTTRGGVAQVVEQRTHKPRAGGSKPSTATILPAES